MRRSRELATCGIMGRKPAVERLSSKRRSLQQNSSSPLIHGPKSIVLRRGIGAVNDDDLALIFSRARMK